MGTPPVDTRKKQEAIRLYRELKSSALVGERMGVAGLTVRRWLDSEGIDRTGSKKTGKAWREARKIEDPAPEFILPDFPVDDIPVDQIIDLQCKRFETRKASHDAHTWFPVTLKTDKPIGILWFGDPHLDDNGANWPVLKRHVEVCRTNEGIYGANIGDTTNNWAGRLVRLYANQDTSVKTARRLAEWFMLDSGVTWLIWLLGNHDDWGDGAAILAQMAKRHGTRKIVCHDWEARFSLKFPGGWQPRVYASHDFKGHSMWNPIHGAMREGQMGEDADLYVCGHKHNAYEAGGENPARGKFQRFIRLRGYKYMDDHARHIGAKEQQGGCGALTIFDPARQSISVHFDVEEGAEILRFKRGRDGRS